jgi:hypothetical protein
MVRLRAGPDDRRRTQGRAGGFPSLYRSQPAIYIRLTNGLVAVLLAHVLQEDAHSCVRDVRARLVQALWRSRWRPKSVADPELHRTPSSSHSSEGKGDYVLGRDCSARDTPPIRFIRLVAEDCSHMPRTPPNQIYRSIAKREMNEQIAQERERTLKWRELMRRVRVRGSRPPK